MRKAARKILSCSVTALAVSLSIHAKAADLPSIKSAPVSTPAPKWTGFYAGLNAGAILSGTNSANVATYPLWNPAYYYNGNASNIFSSEAASGIFPLRYGGFLGGGQIGYNLQLPVMEKAVIVGFETDFQGDTATGNVTNSFRIAPVANIGLWYAISKMNTGMYFFGSAKAKFGYLITPNVMLYANGGFAYGGVNFSNSLFEVGIAGQSNFTAPGYYTGYGSKSTMLSGWTAGGGLEWMLTHNLSAKIQYDYYDLGSVYTNSVNTRYTTVPNYPIYFLQASQASTRFNGNVIRMGVNYHFNFASAPVVAKY